ncbi:MAG: hypothetical protein Q8O25_00705 [Sulfurisoma sp.]|nr:hypothetical protein [Sulfurisoma sp.]
MEPTSTDMFPVANLTSSTRVPTRWLLVSNHLNFLYMLAAGLVMPPMGFGKKYYQDTLAAYPGWIPLFANDVPKAAIAYSVSERKHLIPCIATMNLASLHGKVMAIDSEGLAKEVNFPDGLDGSEQILLIPAPLPVTWVTSIAFQSSENRATCEADARDFGNVPLLDFKREVSAPAFSKATGWHWPPSGIDIPSKEVVLDASFAAGGVMAMLLRLGNLGEVGMQACRLAFDAEADVVQSITDPLISSLGMWMQTGQTIDTGDISSRLYWGAVMKVAACRFSDDPVTPLEVVLDYLGSAGDGLDERMKIALVKLVNDLRTIASFTDSTITEIFECHSKSFSRVLTLFFLREKCADLLSFKHPLLTESDIIAAAILFAARDGWLGLPLQLRNFPGSQVAISHRMAAMAHHMAGTGLNLGSPPSRPLPLRELFSFGPKGWSAAQKDAALVLARECKWGCIQTRVSLGKGDYRLLVDGGGMHIIVAGEAKAVETEVDREKFFSALASAPISDKQDRKVRDLLKA